MTSRYAASEVAAYLTARFGFHFTENALFQPLEDFIWEQGRKAQLRRREVERTALSLIEDAGYVAKSIAEGRANAYEPMERADLAELAKDANRLEVGVHNLVSVHRALGNAWAEHGTRDGEDVRMYGEVLDEMRSLKARAQGLEDTIRNLSADREALAAELGAAGDQLASLARVTEEATASKQEANRLAQRVSDVVYERDEAQKAAHDLHEELEKMTEMRDELRGSLDDAVHAHRLAVDEYHTMSDKAQEQQNRADEAEEQVRIMERKMPEPYNGPLG